MKTYLIREDQLRAEDVLAFIDGKPVLKETQSRIFEFKGTADNIATDPHKKKPGGPRPGTGPDPNR